ncbi:Tfp pilus assembly protein FimT/FimU [Pseudoxanthomonas sangjuensis]|uniref:GspH/FimT family pseudopilin n=1 Tax=Pseudoxanthomonas sangjuensis TaxID=1503750 RepID=UPI001391335B|nr:GspH/FimT family pseudopilin [Pseudoxanthomonas sangjuensis]KAF1713310.1 hypothetical protein CSC71_08280 [Pseudoxanthomonas sangjuensis]
MSIRLERGFTLVELMIAVAVLAILAAAATPSMGAIINNNRLRAATNETVATLQSARLEAIRGNRRAVACMSADPDAALPACNPAGSSGWIVFLDADRDGALGANERLLRRASLPGQVRMLPSAAFANGVAFNADGFARDAGGNLLNATVSLCLPTTRPQENARLVSIGSGSRIRSNRVNAAGECPTPGDRP